MCVGQPGDNSVILGVMRVFGGMEQPSAIVVLHVVDFVARAQNKAQLLSEFQRHWIVEAADQQRGAVAKFCKRDVVRKALLIALLLTSQAGDDIGYGSDVSKGDEAVFGRVQITAFDDYIRRQRHEELLAMGLELMGSGVLVKHVIGEPVHGVASNGDDDGLGTAGPRGPEGLELR